MSSQQEPTSLVRFDAAMNSARHILAKEVMVSQVKMTAVRKISLISEYIEKNTVEIKSPIIQFLSAYENEDADKIAIDVAIIFSETYGKKVLFVDACTSKKSGVLKELRDQSQISINDLCMGNISDKTPFLNIKRSTFFYAPLINIEGNDADLVDMTGLKNFLITARANFDYIILASERSVTNTYPFSMGAIAQMNILVVSAIKTRRQVVAHVLKSLSDMDAVLSATILTYRTFFIPAYIYNFLFSSGKRPAFFSLFFKESKK